MQTRTNEETAPLVWDFSPLNQNDLEEVRMQISQFVAKWESRSDWLSEPKVLAEALFDYEHLMRHFGLSGDTGYFWSLRHHQEETNKEITAQTSKIEEFSREMNNQMQFFDLRLSKVDQSSQDKFLTDSSLTVYRHYLERLFAQAKYLLSEKEEIIMTLKGGPAFSSWTRMTSSFLSSEERGGKNLPQLLSDFTSTSKKTRDRAAIYVNSILERHVEVAENEVNAILLNEKIDHRLRQIDRPDIPRLLADDIDPLVVDTMVQAVNKRFDLPARFYKLKSEMLGVPKLAYHERGVPFGKISTKYSYSQACGLVDKVLTNLDTDFGMIFRQFVDQGQIDVYPKQGKSGGAFCACDRPTTPVYILLNHADRLQDVLTLAHEVGHGINDTLMKSLSSALDYGSPLSTAEVASTFMEDFVLQELMAQAKPSQKLTLIVQKLDDDMGTIFRQVAAYQFERELHDRFRQAGYLDKKVIGQIFQKHMRAYMGDYVEQSPGSENYWVHWSHFRRFFYVYSYASGLLISKSLQYLVKNNRDFVSNIKKILSAGSSASPKQIFKTHANLDITQADFWTKGLSEVELLLVQAETLWKEVKA